MNKKKFFNKSMIFVVLGLLAVSGVMAVLVEYLSNTADMDVAVESPAVISFAEVSEEEEWTGPINAISTIAGYADEDWQNNINLGTTGLSTVYAGVRIDNNADVAISDKTLKLTITTSDYPSSATCADITSLTFIDVGCSEGTSCYQVVQELAGMGLCSQNDGVVTYEVPINHLGAEQSFKYPVTVTFGNVQPTEYSFEAQLMDYSVVE